MTNLIQWRNLPDILPPRYFNLFLFFLFLLFLLLFSFLLLEFDSEVGKFKLNHIINHFLNLILNFWKDSLLYFSHLWLVLWTYLIFPFFCMLLNLLLHYQDCLSRAISRIVFFKFILLCQFLFFLLAFSLLFLFCFCSF